MLLGIRRRSGVVEHRGHGLMLLLLLLLAISSRQLRRLFRTRAQVRRPNSSGWYLQIQALLYRLHGRLNNVLHDRLAGYDRGHWFGNEDLLLLSHQLAGVQHMRLEARRLRLLLRGTGEHRLRRRDGRRSHDGGVRRARCRRLHDGDGGRRQDRRRLRLRDDAGLRLWWWWLHRLRMYRMLLLLDLRSGGRWLTRCVLRNDFLLRLQRGQHGALGGNGFRAWRLVIRTAVDRPAVSWLTLRSTADLRLAGRRGHRYVLTFLGFSHRYEITRNRVYQRHRLERDSLLRRRRR